MQGLGPLEFGPGREIVHVSEEKRKPAELAFKRRQILDLET
jgi:hypothetical protein